MEITVKEPSKDASPKKDQQPSDPRLVIKLIKHWTPDPDDEVTVIGWKKKAVVLRLATGGTYVAEPEMFVKGEIAPPPVVGALNESHSDEWQHRKGQPPVFIRSTKWTKIWRDTVIEVDADIGYDLIEKNIAQIVRPV